MSLFRLDASILPATSASRSLADLVEAEWTASHPDSTVVRRDLAADPVPATAWADAVTGGFTDEAQRTPAQRDASALATQLRRRADRRRRLLFAVPLYNYGVSQHFKTWFDLAYTDPRIDPRARRCAASPPPWSPCSAATTPPGTPKEGWDHSTGWLRRVLQDVWGLDLRVVERPFTLVGVNPALDAFTEQPQEDKSWPLSTCATNGSG